MWEEGKCGEGVVKFEKELLERQLNEVAAECDRLQVCVWGREVWGRGKCGGRIVGGKDRYGKGVRTQSMRRGC